MNSSKVGTIFFVSVLALAGIGISFAGLTDTIHVYGTVSTATVELAIEEYSGTWVWKVWGCLDAPEGEIIITNDPDYDPGTDPLYENCNTELISWAKGRDPRADEINPDTGVLYDAVIEFYNLFPCIDFHADIVFHYIGTIPAKIINVDMGWTGEETLLPDGTTGDWLAYLHSTGGLTYQLGQSAIPVQIHYCDYLYFNVNIHLPQDNLFQGLSGTGYLTIELQQWNDECDGTTEDKVLNLPDPTTYVADCDLTGVPGPMWGTYFDADLTGIPYDPDYNAWDGVWPCWCVDQYTGVQNGLVELWDTYDPLMPYPDDPGDWECVNWIINNLDDFPGAGMQDIQDAIWYFVDGGNYPSDPDAQAIVAAAIPHTDFVPQEGQDCAVLLWPVNADHTPRISQIVFIVVDP